MNAPLFVPAYTDVTTRQLDSNTQTAVDGRVNAPVTALGESRTTTTLADYLAQGAVYNVKDYGAKGDGAADDTAAIRDALAAAAAVSSTPSGGACVYFPRGVYLVTRNNAPHNLTGHNIRITGEGRGTIIKNGLPPSTQISEMLNAFSGAVLFGTVLENLAFQGFTALRLLNSTDVTVRNVHCSGYRHGDMHGEALYFYGCARVRVSNCDIQDYSAHIYLAGTSAGRCRDVVISGNTLINGAKAGTYTAKWPVGVYVYFGDDVVVSGNTFRDIYSATDNGDAGTGLGYGVYEGDGACAALTVTGNEFTYTGNGSKRAAGIYVNTAAIATISGNTIRSTAGANLKYAIRASMKARDGRHTIAGNTIDATGIVSSASEAQAILVDNSGADPGTTGTTIVDHNQITGGRIVAAGSSAATPNWSPVISGNVIDGAPVPGGAIAVIGAAGKIVRAPRISANTIRRSAGAGIVLTHALRARIESNDVIDPNTAADVREAAGIAYDSTSFGGIVRGNTITVTPGGPGHLTVGIALASSPTLFKVLLAANTVAGMPDGTLYSGGYAAAPTGGWDWVQGDVAPNTSPEAGAPTNWVCVHAAMLELTADARAGARRLAVSSVTGAKAGDVLFLWANVSAMDSAAGDAKAYHITTVQSVDSDTALTIAASIPAGESYAAGTAGCRVMRWRAGPSLAE